MRERRKRDQTWDGKREREERERKMRGAIWRDRERQREKGVRKVG